MGGGGDGGEGKAAVGAGRGLIPPGEGSELPEIPSLISLIFGNIQGAIIGNIQGAIILVCHGAMRGETERNVRSLCGAAKSQKT